MTIHHAVLKRAASLGVTLSEPEHGLFAATLGQTTTESTTSAKDALDKLLETIVPAERLAEANGKKPRKAKKAKAKKKARKSDEDGEDGEGEEGDEETGTKSVIAPKYKIRYKPHKDTCGDPLVQPVFDFLHPDGEDVDQKLLVKLGRDNGVDVMDRWGHLKDRRGGWNVGMARMNLVNVLRGKLRRGDDVTIGNKTVKGQKKD